MTERHMVRTQPSPGSRVISLGARLMEGERLPAGDFISTARIIPLKVGNGTLGSSAVQLSVCLDDAPMHLIGVPSSPALLGPQAERIFALPLSLVAEFLSKGKFSAYLSERMKLGFYPLGDSIEISLSFRENTIPDFNDMAAVTGQNGQTITTQALRHGVEVPVILRPDPKGRMHMRIIHPYLNPQPEALFELYATPAAPTHIA